MLMDDERGGYLAASHLLQLGHGGWWEFSRRMTAREPSGTRGYVRALQEAHIPYDPDLVIWFHTEDRKVKPALMLRRWRQSTGSSRRVVCYNDQIALEAYRALTELGLRVPEDVSLTGYDDSFIASSGPLK